MVADLLLSLHRKQEENEKECIFIGALLPAGGL
jgi:hypothetical protein